MTIRQNENKFFEVRMSLYAGSNERKAFDKDALKAMGFNEVDFDAVKAVLNTDVLPKEAFNPFLSIRKNVQDYLASKGQVHPLMGRVFNPADRVEIIEYLKEKQDEYAKAKQEFLANFNGFALDQLKKVENSAQIKGLDPAPLVKAVEDAQPSKRYYENRMGFDFLDITVELDSDQWQDLIDKINSDLIEKTCYELSRDAAKIRDVESPRTRAKKLLELTQRLHSLDFYVPGTAVLGNNIENIVNFDAGGIKPAKEYSQKESLILTGLPRVLDQNATNLVKQTSNILDLMKAEAKRIDSLLDAEDETEEAVESADSKSQSEVMEEATWGSTEVEKTDSEESDDSTLVVPTEKTGGTSAGAFSF